MKIMCAGLLMLLISGSAAGMVKQASVGSLADFMKKQDDGIAESVRMSQDRARTSKLVMGTPPGKKPGKLTDTPPEPNRPAVIHLAVHARQTGHDNRRQNNVR